MVGPLFLLKPPIYLLRKIYLNMKKQWWQRDFIYLVESSATQTYEEAFIEHRDDLKDPKVAYLGDPTDEAIQDLEHLNVQYKSVKIKYAIQYRTSNGQPIYINNTSSDSTTGWGAVIVSNTYSNGIGEIEFNTEFHNIAQEAFSGQTALTEIYIPSQVTSVLDGAFYNCSSLAVCELPYTVEEIDSMAFNGCSSLVAFNMPSSLTTLGTMAFAGCSSLRMVVVPATVTDMGTGVFSDCTGLTGTTIQNGISAITMNTFDGCYSLEYVRIPDSVQTIGQSAFTQCSQLTGVEIGTGLTSVGNYAFCGCSQLVNIWISATTAPSFTLGNTFSGVGMYGTLAFPEGSDYSSWLSTTQHGLGYYHWNASPYLKQPLTFVAKQDNTVVSFNRPTTSTSATYSISNKLQYSTDNGTTWTPLTGSSTATALTFPTLSSGQTLQVKAADNTSGPTVLLNSAPTTATTSYLGLGRFSVGGTQKWVKVEGNVMSLIGSGNSYIEKTSISNACTFGKLFSGCSSITNIENLVLPATSLADACYFAMFANCNNYTDNIKELPATNVPASGYGYMFMGSYMHNVPTIMATTVGDRAMQSMFMNCINITAAPDLPATTLGNGCYRGMFANCTKLSEAPILTAATELNTGCYALMFCGDTKINYIKMTGRYNPSTVSQPFCGWTYGVSGSGVFVKHGLMLTIDEDSASGIPVGWTSQLVEGTEYLTMKIMETGETKVYFNGTTSGGSLNKVLATTNNGYNWTALTSSQAATLDSSGIYKSVAFKQETGVLKPLIVSGNIIPTNIGDIISGTGIGRFTLTTASKTVPTVNGTTTENAYKKMRIIGNPLSLYYGDNFYGVLDIPYQYAFSGLFYQNDPDNTSNVLLPATGLTKACYLGMFYRLRFTTKCPVSELPATSVTPGSYAMMFSDSYRMTGTPEFTINELVNGVECTYMFYNCTGLVSTVSELPAVTPKNWCYFSMYYGCKSLRTAPSIKLSYVSDSCCTFMFRECSALTTVPYMDVTSIGVSGCAGMFYNCKSLTNVPDQLSCTTISDHGCQSMFYGCTSLQQTPIIPVSAVPLEGCYSMYYGCYNITGTQESIGLERCSIGASGCAYMYYGCSKLKAAPDLPATSVQSSGYAYMFMNCSQLTSADTVLPSGTSTAYADVCYHMFDGCTSLTSIPSKLYPTSLRARCYGYMYSKCSGLTVIDQDFLPSTTMSNAASAYTYMFEGCGNLTTSPKLPASTLSAACYAHMFSACTKLNPAPVLSASSVMAPACYSAMFYSCTSLLETTPLTSATGNNLAVSCYTSMFANCTSISAVSPSVSDALPAMAMKSYCYAYMFSGCTGLQAMPALPASALAISCYEGTFLKCSNSNFKTIQPLTAKTMSSSCYKYMFSACTSLTSATRFDCTTATTIASACYYGMFGSCTSLRSVNVPALNASGSSTSAFSYMFCACTSTYFTYTPQLAGPGSGGTGTTSGEMYLGMFCGCTKLTGITSPINSTGVSSGGCYGMFCGCSVLKTPTTWPNGFTLPGTGLSASCYSYMFRGCSGLTTAATMLATSIPASGCLGMYLTCTGLTSVPDITANSVGSGGCKSMFSSCSSLVTPPALSPTSLTYESYAHMFNSCTSLTTTPVINDASLSYSACSAMFYSCKSITSGAVDTLKNVTSVDYGACCSMFGNCTSLNVAPVLPATSVGYYSYSYMFSGCTSLTNAQFILPATTLGTFCYENMFCGCTRLVIAPELPAMTASSNCYLNMFSGCTSLTQQYETLARSSFQETGGVINSETMKYNQSSTWSSIIVDCEKYAGGTLSFSATGTSFIFLTAMPVFGEVVSPAGGATGLDWNNTASVTRNVPSDAKYFYICTHDASAVRPVSDLSFSSPNFTLPATTLATYCYRGMFGGCRSLNANFELPATDMNSYCYYDMFSGCTSLTKTPELPATTLASNCYYYMFEGCTNLVSASTLPATTMVNGCYGYMFRQCTSLVEPPVICATTLASSCFYYMFSNCTSLTKSPVLKATTLVTQCYQYMFYNCTSLTEVTCLADSGITTGTSTSTNNTYQWMYGVPTGTNVGTFYKSSNAGVSSGSPGRYWPRGVHGIPNDWTYTNYTS